MRYTEQELVQGCRAGKPALQQAFYDAYAARLYALCLRYCPDAMEAEDVLHVAFVKAFKAMDSFEGGSLEGWLRRIATRTAIDAYKARKRKPELLSTSPADEGEDKAYLPEVHTQDADPLAQLSAEDLRAMIATLPDGARLVFNLYAVEGYDHAEIGAMLGITASSSRSQLVRARQTLQARIRQLTA